jgi:hypothetical protein
MMDIKHEKFAIAYLANKGNGTAAYQLAYPKTSYGAARVGANRLLKIPEIQEFISEKRANLSEELNITVQSQLQDLELLKDKFKELINLASKNELTKDERFQMEFLFNLLKTPSYVAAISEQNRILGFHINKQELEINNSSVQLYLPENNRPEFKEPEDVEYE